MKISTHPVPGKYHDIFYIGKNDRRGNIIDFKIPPVIIDAQESIADLKSSVFKHHIEIDEVPMTYTEAKPFLIVRPSAIPHSVYIREELESSELTIEKEYELDSFIKLSDVIYSLNPETIFHWQWRVITLCIHSSGFQDQNMAKVFVLGNTFDRSEHEVKIMDLKKRIREDLGETPVLIRENKKPSLALGIHHLHAPDFDRVSLEYNALMHCVNRTSVFS